MGSGECDGGEEKDCYGDGSVGGSGRDGYIGDGFEQ